MIVTCGNIGVDPWEVEVEPIEEPAEEPVTVPSLPVPVPA